MDDTEVTSFYLRGDLGWSFLEWSGGDDDSAVSLGGGVGYQFNENMRADITADWAGDYNVAPGADMSTTTVWAISILTGPMNRPSPPMWAPVSAMAGWMMRHRAMTAALPMA